MYLKLLNHFLYDNTVAMNGFNYTLLCYCCGMVNGSNARLYLLLKDGLKAAEEGSMQTIMCNT